MIDGSEKRNCWWWFEFQIPRVIERRNNWTILEIVGATLAWKITRRHIQDSVFADLYLELEPLRDWDRLGNFRELQLVDSYLGNHGPIITHASSQTIPENKSLNWRYEVLPKFL